MLVASSGDPVSFLTTVGVWIAEIFCVFFKINLDQFFREINMVAEQKLKGPASYFPSIEKKYGQPIEHWIKLVQKQYRNKKAP